jgi:hypothetical protein
MNFFSATVDGNVYDIKMTPSTRKSAATRLRRAERNLGIHRLLRLLFIALSRINHNLQNYFCLLAANFRFYSLFTLLLLIMAAALRALPCDAPLRCPSDTLNVVALDTIAPADDLGLDFPVEYTAEDSTVLDVVNERILLYGKARVVYGEMEVAGDVIVFSMTDFTARAAGKPDSLGRIVERATFKDGASSFEEDSLAYNFKSQRGVSYGVRTEQGEAHLLSAVSKKASNNWISVGKGKLTTCNAENPHYHFQLSKAMVIPDEKVVSGPLYMKFRKIPTPLALPFGFFPNKQEASQGILLPGYGNANEKGFFIQNLGYYIPVNDHLDTKFMFDVYTRGSWAVRNVTGYKKLYRYNGNFNISRVVNVSGLRELPNYGKSTNFNIQWTHNQDPRARPNTTFSASVNMGSLNNFRNNLNTSQTDFLSSTWINTKIHTLRGLRITLAQAWQINS